MENPAQQSQQQSFETMDATQQLNALRQGLIALQRPWYKNWKVWACIAAVPATAVGTSVVTVKVMRPAPKVK